MYIQIFNHITTVFGAVLARAGVSVLNPLGWPLSDKLIAKQNGPLLSFVCFRHDAMFSVVLKRPAGMGIGWNPDLTAHPQVFQSHLNGNGTIPGQGRWMRHSMCIPGTHHGLIPKVGMVKGRQKRIEISYPVPQCDYKALIEISLLDLAVGFYLRHLRYQSNWTNATFKLPQAALLPSPA